MTMDRDREWLQCIGLSQYGDVFEQNGWDDMETILTMTESDLKEIIEKPGHVRKLIISISKLHQKYNPHVATHTSQEPCEIQKTYTDLADNKSEVADPCSANVDKDLISNEPGICQISPSEYSDVTNVHSSSNVHCNESDSDDGCLLLTRKQVCDSNSEKSVSVCKTSSQSGRESTEDNSSLVVSLPNTNNVAVMHNFVTERQRSLVQTQSLHTTVIDSKNVTIARNLQIIKAETDETTSKFETQISSCLDDQRKKEKLFVPTAAYREASDILDDRNWVVIIGNPGDGKSAIAYKLLLDHERQGFNPLIVTSPQDWKTMVSLKHSDEHSEPKDKHAKRQIVLIDNMFGVFGSNEQLVHEWLCLIDVMGKVLSEKKGYLKVICSSRKDIFNRIESKISKYPEFRKLAIVDLTVSPFLLTYDEKLHILNNYFDFYKIHESKYPSDGPSSDDIATINLNYGFPHCVEIYCSNPLIRKQGKQFFQYPLEVVQSEIKLYQMNEKTKYCALILLLLSENNAICIESIDSNSDIFQTCLELSGLTNNNSVYVLLDAFISLDNVYLLKDVRGSYIFKHDSFREIVAVHFLRSFPQHAIQLLDVTILLTCTYLIHETQPKIQMAVTLPESVLETLAERFADEIMKENTYQVFSHNSWLNESFQAFWLKYITKGHTSDTQLARLLKQKYRIGFCQIGFLTCLAFYRLETLMKRLLSLPIISRYQTSALLMKQATSALVIATAQDLSDSLLQQLIVVGADVNGTLDEYHFSFWLDIPIFENALMNAIENGNAKNVEILILNGANVFQFTPSNNAFKLAMVKKSSSVLKCLASHLDKVSDACVETENKTYHIRVKRFLEIKYAAFLFQHYIKYVSDISIFQVMINYLKEKKIIDDYPRQYSKRVTKKPWLDRFYSKVGEPTAEIAENFKETDDESSSLRQYTTFHMILNERASLLKDGTSKATLELMDEWNCGVRDETGHIPIFYALKASIEIDLNILSHLVSLSDIKTVDPQGRNCFHFLAQSSYHGNVEVLIKSLRDKGLDINTPDSKVKTALPFTVSFEMFEAFFKHGAKLNGLNKACACIIMQILELNKGDVLGKLSFSLSHGMDPNHTDSQGYTIMHYLVGTTYSIETKHAVVDLLLKFGCKTFDEVETTRKIFEHTFNSSYRKCNRSILRGFSFLLKCAPQKVLSECSGDVLQLISESKVSNFEKVACTAKLLEKCKDVDITLMLGYVLRWNDLDVDTIEVLLSYLPKSYCFYHNAELLHQTLLSEQSESVKHFLLCLLIPPGSTDTFRVVVQNQLSLDERIKILSSPSFLNVYKNQDFHLESLTVAEIPFNQLASDRQFVKALARYAYRGIELTNILGERNLSLLANELAKKKRPRALFDLVRNHRINFQLFDDTGNTLIHNVVKCKGRIVKKILKAMCSSNVDVNVPNLQGETPIYIASGQKNPNFQTIRWLVLNGALLDAYYQNMPTPFQELMRNLSQNKFLCKKGFDKVESFITFLFSTRSIKERLDNFGKTSLMYILEFATPEGPSFNILVHILCDKQPKDMLIEDMDGRCLLHYVAKANLPDNRKKLLANILIQKGLKTTSLDTHGQYPIELTLFSHTPSISLYETLSKGVNSNRAAQVLLNLVNEFNDNSMVFIRQFDKLNISVNWQDITGVSFLSTACRFWMIECVEKLLDKGSDLNLVDVLGQSPILTLLFSEWTSEVCFNYCVCFGLNLFQELKLQKESQLPWHIKTKRIHAILNKAMKKEVGVNLSLHDKIIEKINSCLKILEILLERGADPNQLDMYGKGPLHYCAEAPVIDTLICPFMEILLLHGADVNLEDFEGRTPLMLCARFGSTKYRRMNILIKAGANLLCRDYGGYTVHDHTKQSFCNMLYKMTYVAGVK